MSQAIKKIVIAGGGTAGWMTAAALSKLMGANLDITLVESEAIGTVGVGEATIPTLVFFHRLLGIDEAEFLAATQGTYKLGIRFENWRDQGKDYLHAFGVTGQDCWACGFQHFWMRGRQLGLAGDFGEYCLERRAAEAHRFSHLPNNGLNYAFHFDASLYAAYLRKFSASHGVKRVEGKIDQVLLHPDNGYIRALKLDSGRELEGDFFIDCTGMRALLIEKTLHTGFESWSHWLPCDSAQAVPSVRSDDFTPYTRSTRRKAGWQWRIPLQHRTGNGYVYSSADISDDEAAATLLANLDGEALADPRVLRFKAGKRQKAWAHNCIGMGLAGGFLEPLESTSIYLVQMAIMHMLTLMPAERAIDPALPCEFNRVMDVEYDRIRDFLILHYVANEADAPLWERVTAAQVPDTLEDKIDRFRHRGHVQAYRDGLFGPPSWQAVFVGQGIEPRAADRLADVLPAATVDERLANLAATIADAAATLPSHADFIARYCPAPAP